MVGIGQLAGWLGEVTRVQKQRLKIEVRMFRKNVVKQKTTP